MNEILAALQLFNLAAPGVASLIRLLKNDDGTTDITIRLQKLEPKIVANIVKANQWLAEHPPTV